MPLPDPMLTQIYVTRPQGLNPWIMLIQFDGNGVRSTADTILTYYCDIYIIYIYICVWIMLKALVNIRPWYSISRSTFIPGNRTKIKPLISKAYFTKKNVIHGSGSGKICFAVIPLLLMAPSHYLNQCWNIVNWTPRNKLQWNLNRNSYIFIHVNAFENVICEMAVDLSRPPCVNSLRLKI